MEDEWEKFQKSIQKEKDVNALTFHSACYIIHAIIVCK